MTEFLGFPRPDGSAGIRNELLVLSVTGLTGPAARRIAGSIAGARVVTTGYGSGLLGEDREINFRVLENLATHPNVGAVLVVGADPPLVERIAAAAEAASRPSAALALDDCDHDALTLADRGIRAGASLRREISRRRREPVPVGRLALGLECGRSDPSSGLIANPLVGRMAERVVAEGGIAMIGETTEWLGAESVLAARAATPEVAEAIHAAASRRETRAREAGLELTGNNPSATNINAGLSTIEEKSLGAVAKIGRCRLEGVIGYGERPSGPGAWLMDAPAYAPESLTGFAAAGSTMALFTTGVGNSYGSRLMPTLKLSANPETTARLKSQLDFDASAVFKGEAELDQAADELMALVLEIASGTLSWAEVLKEEDEVISRFGAGL